MKKIYIIIISSITLVFLILFLGVTISSRGSEKVSNWLKAKDSVWFEKDSLMEYLKSDFENVSLNNLKLVEDEYSFLGTLLGPQHYHGGVFYSGRAPTLLRRFNDFYPVEHVQIIDDDNICVVSKIKTQHDNAEKYVYIIFERTVKDLEAGKDIEKTGWYEKWHLRPDEYYYVQSVKTFEDYSYIDVGSHLSEEEAEVLLLNREFERHNSNDLIASAEYVVLLKDGLMSITLGGNEISYESTLTPAILISEWTVQDVKFYPYGSTENVPENYSILKNGFVPEFP